MERTRREFLKISGLFGAIAAAGAGTAWGIISKASEWRDNPIYQFLCGLPDEIPGAKPVDRFRDYYGSSSRLLIHVKQVHEHPASNIDTLLDRGMEYYEEWRKLVEDEEGKKELIAVQNDIYEIVSFFIRHAGIESVYREGQFWEGDNELGDTYTDVSEKTHAVKRLVEEGKIYTLQAEDMDLIAQSSAMTYSLDDHDKNLKRYEREATELETKIKDTTDQNAKAELQRKLVGLQKVISIETDLYKERAFESRKLQEQREDFLLSQIAGRDEPVALTVYGGRHSWRQNVWQWNKRKPDLKFSLLEITPESYH